MIVKMFDFVFLLLAQQMKCLNKLNKMINFAKMNSIPAHGSPESSHNRELDL